MAQAVTFSQALILGAVQGLTEFLPVSSSGHLVLMQKLLGLKEPELLLDIMLHVGTLAAIAAVFFRELRGMAAGAAAALLRRRAVEPASPRLAWLILVGTIPTVLMGVLFSRYFEMVFGSAPWTGGMLLITGGLLFLTRIVPHGRRGLDSMGVPDALLIGALQGFALLPGISRSGATISGALFLGLSRPLAGSFSFLLAVPAIVGALLLKGRELAALPPQGAGALVLGALLAAGVGFIALKLLLRLLREGKLSSFAYYCWALGALALLLSLG
ncbi:MAG: undecaprenyl-diphosphate phosphatase [Nitrospinota bacterium]